MSDELGYQIGLLSGARPSTLLRCSRRLRHFDPRRAARLAGLTAGAVVSVPLRAGERLLAGPDPDPSEVRQPVFIIGHWRSGTTHLHNLLTCDPRFGYLTMFDALAPDYPTVSRRWLRPLFEQIVPERRPMDNMVWPMGAPQEEEIPLAKVCAHSWYTQFLFPRDAMSIFDETVLFDGASPAVRRQVGDRLAAIVARVSRTNDHRRLVLKNPVNTARVGLLLERFPDARFVFIHRDPYEVFPSTVNLHRRLLALTALQSYDDRLVEANVTDLYPRVIGRYLDERKLVPEGRLVEVGYGELTASPLDVLARIYDRLDLGPFDDVAPLMSDYLGSIAGYRRNGFAPLSDRTVAMLNDRWSVGFDAFGYERRSFGAEELVLGRT